MAGEAPAHAGLTHRQAVLPVEVGVPGIEQVLQSFAHDYGAP